MSWTVSALVSGVTGTASLTVNAGALASVSVSGPTSVTAGGTATFTATGFDAEGNSLGVETASWSITSGAAGSWSSNVYTSHTAGSWTVTATYSSLQGTASLTVNAGALNHFVVGAPGSVTAGSAFTLTVTAKDAYGNTIKTYSSSVGLTVSSGSISPTNTGTSGWSSGVWNGLVTLTVAGSSVSITATDGTHAGTSNSFTVDPGAAILFVVSGFPSSLLLVSLTVLR